MSDTAKGEAMAQTSPEDYPEQIPELATEEDAREFWATHDSARYFEQMEDVTAAVPANLRRGPGPAGSRARKRPAEGRMDLVSLRFPAEMIEAVKAIAVQRHLPHQTLMRSRIGERLAQEQQASEQQPDTGSASG